jgi:hypothetical protein
MVPGAEVSVAAGAMVGAATVGTEVGVACGLQAVVSRTRATNDVSTKFNIFIFSPLRALNKPTKKSTLQKLKSDCFYLNIRLEKIPALISGGDRV